MDCPPVKSGNDYLIPPTSNMTFFHRPPGGARALSVAFGQSSAFYLEYACPLGPVSAPEGSTELNIETIFPLKIIFFTARWAVW